MSLYKRGDVWWYKFRFAGQMIRESSKSESKTVAKDAERVRRRELEESWNQIKRRKLPPLFSIAAAGLAQDAHGHRTLDGAKLQTRYFAAQDGLRKTIAVRPLRGRPRGLPDAAQARWREQSHGEP